MTNLTKIRDALEYASDPMRDYFTAMSKMKAAIALIDEMMRAEQPVEYTVKELADAIGIAECLFKQEHGSLGSLESKWMHIASAIVAGLPKRELSDRPANHNTGAEGEINKIDILDAAIRLHHPELRSKRTNAGAILGSYQEALNASAQEKV